MRLIINASLKQVNLVWSTVSVLKVNAPVSYPGNQSSAYFPLFSKVHHTFTSPYPMPFTCIILLWIWSPRHYFFPPILFLTRKSQVSTVISAPNLKPRLFLNHFLSNEANLFCFKETGNTWIYSFHSIPLDIPVFHLTLPFQYLEQWTGMTLKLKSLYKALLWNSEGRQWDEVLRSQGLRSQTWLPRFN